MSELYARYDYLMAIEGSYEEELPSILSGGAALVTSDGPFQMPEVEPLTDWQGQLALIAPREGGPVVAFDGLIHLDRSKTGIYMESGEITREEIERMRAGEGPLQVDFFGTTEITAEMAFRQTAGRVQPDVSACILVRPAANPGTAVPFPSYHRIIIGLPRSDPTVVHRADFRNMLRWQLETHAARHGKSIPPDTLDLMVDEGERRVLRDAKQVKLDEDDPLRQRLLTETIEHPDVDVEERREICEYIVSETENSQQQIDLRLLKHAISDYIQWKNGEVKIHWKQLVVSSMQDYFAPVQVLGREERKVHEQDHILELIEEFSETSGSKEAVVEQWMASSGKKKTAFYDRLKELPEEWNRRYQALPDNRSDSPIEAEMSVQPKHARPCRSRNLGSTH